MKFKPLNTNQKLDLIITNRIKPSNGVETELGPKWGELERIKEFCKTVKPLLYAWKFSGLTLVVPTNVV